MGLGGNVVNLFAGAVRVLSDNNPWGKERATDCLQQPRGVGDFGVLSKERAGEGGGEISMTREGGSGGANIGGIRSAFGEDKRSDEDGRDGSSRGSDPEGGDVGLAGAQGVNEVEYAGSPVRPQRAGGEGGRAD